MARFSDVFTEGAAPREQRPVSQKIKRIHYSKLLESQYQYRDRNEAVVIALADLLKADGKVLEPLVVRKSGPGSDTYEIISGHKRCLASKYLAEQEHLEDFAFLPCVEESMSDIRAEFAVYSSNGYDEKTPYEIMREIEGMARLLKEHPEEFPEYAGKGRLVEKLAAKMNMSRSVVSDYQNISHNLGTAGMESFKQGKLDKSAAVTLASMPEDKQEEALEQGLTKREDIKSYISSQTKEPTEKQIRHFAIYVNKILENNEENQWADVLRNKVKDAFGSGTEPQYSFKGSYRGVTLGNADEITWKRCVALIKEYCPSIKGKSVSKPAVEENIPVEEKEDNYEERKDNYEEQLPGQDSVLNHPEWLPEETIEEVEQPVEPEYKERQGNKSWYQIKLEDSLVVKLSHKAKAQGKTLDELVEQIFENYIKQK